jgi:hypothetical protein
VSGTEPLIDSFRIHCRFGYLFCTSEFHIARHYRSLITNSALQYYYPHALTSKHKGQFKRLIGEGPSLICWPLQSVAGRLSLRVKQLDVICETKTKDNVFVQVGVAVQYRVVTESAYDAWYRLTNPTSQIQAYVFDVIRSTVPRLELDSAFESKDDIARAVFEQLQNVMKDYGYGKVSILVYLFENNLVYCVLTVYPLLIYIIAPSSCSSYCQYLGHGSIP